MGLLIGGIAYDDWLDRRSLRHLNALTSEPDTLDFDLNPISDDGTACPKPALGSEVIYTLPSGTRIFGGRLTSAPEVRAGFKNVGYSCSCVDWRMDADRKLPNLRRTNVKAGALIVEMFALYTEGFDTSAVDTTGGPTIDAISFRRNARITDILDKLGSITGYVWDIDPEKNVLWHEPGTTAAPISITDTSRNFRDLVVEPNRDELRNRVWVKGGMYPAANPITDTYTGDGLTTNFRLSRKPFGTDEYVVFEDNFSSLDADKWTQTDVSNPSPPAGHINSDGYLFTTIQQGAALAESGWLQVVGGSASWGASRLQSTDPIGRGNGGRRFELDVYVEDAATEGRFGLWNPSDLSALSGEVYGFYFEAGTWKPSEAGVTKTALATVTTANGRTVRLRIVPGATSGAEYWINTDDTGDIGIPEEERVAWRPSYWTKLYTSASVDTIENLAFTAIFNYDFNGRVDRAMVFNPFYNISLTVGGVAKTVGLLHVDEGAGVDALIGNGVAELPVLVFFGDTKPGNGVDVELSYYPGVPIFIKAEDAASIATLAALEGNDGVYEHLIQDDTINSLAMARHVATNDLNEWANPVTTLTFATREAGLRAGQVLSVNLTTAASGREVSGDFLIQSVETRSLGSGNYEYFVTAGSRLKGLQDYILDLLKRGKEAEDADDDNAPLDELVWASDTLTITDSGSVVGPQVTAADTLTFTDVGSVVNGPVPPFVYGTAQYGLSSYA